MDDFFNGFGDELLKLGGPIDWAKRKLGIGKAPASASTPAPNATTPEQPKVKTPKVKAPDPRNIMGSGQEGLKAEGVFGARR